MADDSRTGARSRSISHSEISTLLACPARWDFRYGDALAGSSLEPKAISATPERGKLWGAAVAALHAGEDPEVALLAIVELEGGGAELDALAAEVREILAHYRIVEQTKWPAISLVERELLIDVPLPALNGRGSSSRWRLKGYVDGVATLSGRSYIVEYKLRKSLGDLSVISLSRQIRWYAWALRRMGVAIAGVIHDERLAEAPRAPKILKSGAPSADVRQHITADAYVKACEAAGETPVRETVDALLSRRWQTRHLIEFTDQEIAEVEDELRDSAHILFAADRMRRPLRNATARTCPGCAFRDICADPTDASLVDALYNRRVAKRDRQRED